MSFLNLLYKKIHSKFEDIISPDLDSANDAESNNPLADSSSMDGCGDQHAINVSSEPTAPPFKPQVLDNGRTLLLGVTGNKKQIKANPQYHSTPSSGGVPFTGVTTNKQPLLSTDEIAAILDAPEEEEKDAAIVYKLKCSKCNVNGKIDSFTETFVCPLCGGTMHLIEVYANHSQYSPEEIKQELCVLYSKCIRGDLHAQKTWALLTSQSHSDFKLEEYMRQYIKPHPAVAEKHNSTIFSAWPNKSRSLPSQSPSATQKPIQFTNVLRPANSTVTKSRFLIPELESFYKKVNDSYSIRLLNPNVNQTLLFYLGYKVGRSSHLNALDRQQIILKAFVVDKSFVNAKWNAAMTPERIKAIISFLESKNAANRHSYNDYSVAIKQRNEDIAWLSNYSKFVKDAINIARTITYF